jgi:hypothetical protein
VIKFPFCHLVLPPVLTNLTGSTPLAGYCVSLSSIVHLRLSSWLTRERVPPPDETVHWCLARSLLPVVQGTHPGDKGGEKALSSKSQMSPQKCCGIFQTETQDTEADQQGATIYCDGTDSADSCPKAEPQEQKHIRWEPYMPLQAGYRSKEQGLTHIWLHATILSTSLPSALWSSSHLDSFKFYLPAKPSPLSCYIIRTQTCLLLFWPSSLLHSKRLV